MGELLNEINQILDGHRRGLADVPKAAHLLELCCQKHSPGDVEGFFQLLWPIFVAEPLTPQVTGEFTRSVHLVIIRACAEFGPAGQLPARVFGLVRRDDRGSMDLWAREICPTFQYLLWQHRDRFATAALDSVKAHCEALTSDDFRVEFPGSLTEVLAGLRRTVEQIEFERFERTLTKAVEPRPAPEDLSAALSDLGFPPQIADALRQADACLRSTGPFDPKTAADLLRTSMDEAHRAIVGEIERITGCSYSGKDKDADRRVYMRDRGFISAGEEKFLTCVYSLISQEGTHRLIATKETVLVMQRTVRDYMLLLLRRLAQRKQSGRRPTRPELGKGVRS